MTTADAHTRSRRCAATALAFAATLPLMACTSGSERASERVGQEVREDVRGMRDFLRDRGITINTQLPSR